MSLAAYDSKSWSSGASRGRGRRGLRGGWRRRPCVGGVGRARFRRQRRRRRGRRGLWPSADPP
eukprot:5962844-Pyramimonas_sp.AAC.1